MVNDKRELTTDEYIRALNAECGIIQRCKGCEFECLYIGWCDEVHAAFWARRNNEPVTLVSGGCNG